ncbi:MAG: histidinol dehydrogenase [Eubacteriaceae bacterium]|jgi:histidinol dehydrogenase|nr:histidinol dehydrogenase [Eubacteriaceae bacterium]
MKIYDLACGGSISDALAELKGRSELRLSEIDEAVKAILAEVRRDGDAALRRFASQYDGFELGEIKVAQEEIDEAYESVSPEFLEALNAARDNIAAYHSRQQYSPLSYGEGGIRISQRALPLDRVGIYVPGGSYPYPSTVLMCAVPAACAGVKQIAMATPAKQGGKVSPKILAAARIAGVTEVYKTGGAQAIGALAFGTETIPAVDKICGPGNVYVTAAKRLVFGHVGIDMLAGPSEVLVIADHRATPAYVAADMLAQAEHDANAAAVLVTLSKELALAIEQELESQLSRLPADSLAHASIKANCYAFIARSLQQAVEISNAIAPEHLELACENPEELLPLVRHAGSVFLGDYAPEPLGDYLAGPNHTLPTSGTARFFSPLSAYDFMKRMSVIYYDKEALAQSKDMVARFAREEGLEAHARSVLRRFEE